MTDTMTGGSRGAGAAAGRTGQRPAELSPVAPRVGRRRWHDTRTVVGLVLLLASVGIGAKLFATGSDTTPVVSVTADLAAGHVLVPTDLTVARVRLDPASGAAYLPGSRLGSAVGRVLSSGVGRGELLPAAAIDPQGAAPQRLVPVKVRDGRLPALLRGDRVDVYATLTVHAVPGAPVATCVAVPVVTDAEVGESVQQQESGSDVTLDLLVPPAEAGPLILASEAGAVDVVRHVATGGQQGDVGRAPTTSLGSVGSVGSCGTHA